MVNSVMDGDEDRRKQGDLPPGKREGRDTSRCFALWILGILGCCCWIRGGPGCRHRRRAVNRADDSRPPLDGNQLAVECSVTGGNLSRVLRFEDILAGARTDR